LKKIITYGSFDLFHEGHYKLLKRAKELGDYLIVGVTTEHYDRQRGKLNLVDLAGSENISRSGARDVSCAFWAFHFCFPTYYD
jgi:cytidyltransferase-like protein